MGILKYNITMIKSYLIILSVSVSTSKPLSSTDNIYIIISNIYICIHPCYTLLIIYRYNNVLLPYLHSNLKSTSNTFKGIMIPVRFKKSK